MSQSIHRQPQRKVNSEPHKPHGREQVQRRWNETDDVPIRSRRSRGRRRCSDRVQRCRSSSRNSLHQEHQKNNDLDFEGEFREASIVRSCKRRANRKQMAGPRELARAFDAETSNSRGQTEKALVTGGADEALGQSIALGEAARIAQRALSLPEHHEGSEVSTGSRRLLRTQDASKRCAQDSGVTQNAKTGGVRRNRAARSQPTRNRRKAQSEAPTN